MATWPRSRRGPSTTSGVRSLLSKITTPDIAELCLGHALKGMRKVYDHHLYEPEKREAMERLASLLASIVEGKAT
jgi:integrase